MKIFGLTKVRNESAIMKETLDHWGKICTGGVYVYDDVSTDDTVKICKEHPAVKRVVQGRVWDPDRERAEWYNRQSILTHAQMDAGPDDWFVYFDADERLYFDDWSLLFKKDNDAIACRLYDVYITPEDKDSQYNLRWWVGPEFRTIVMFFRNEQSIGYDKPDQRIVNLKDNARIVVSGFVKHYGKGLSVQHWEDTCDYYINYWPKYREKWEQRKGKAVKTDMKSDFGNSLIDFKLVLAGKIEGIPLELQGYGRK